MPIREQRIAARSSTTPPPAPASPPVLTPVPTTETELDAALAYLAPLWGLSPTEDRERMLGVLSMASALVEEHAPAAPQAIRNEAVVRAGGYFAQSDFGGIRSETIGEKAMEYHLDHQAAFRRSGAMGLLTRWKIRRAGAIG